MKRHSIFGQLIRTILIPLTIILLLLSVIYIKHNYNVLNSFNEDKKYILVEELKKIIEFEDMALAVIEENLTETMKKFSYQLVNNEFSNTLHIKNIDLFNIQNKYNVAFDIYIINQNGEIINTTFKKDLGFNLFNIDEEHRKFLEQILKSNNFVSERLSLEKSTGKQKKYTYQSTIDNLYIIELGSYSIKATELINSMNKGIQGLKDNERLNLVDIDLFISKENRKSFNSENSINDGHVSIFKRTFINKTDYDSVITENDKIHLYEYIYFERDKTNLYSDSVIRLIFDITDDKKFIRKELFTFSGILGLTILFLFFLFYIRARLLTTPISNLENQVRLIESGDMSIRAKVSGNNEITGLSLHFNSMINKLESLYQNLENKVIERTALLEKQKKSITDSIRYAQKIQSAVLPQDEKIAELFPESFIYYKPGDIVSGDFYWMTEKEDKIIVAVVDCTGHGVPGGFMSMLGVAFLNEIVNKIVVNKHISTLQASEILNQLRDMVIEALHQTGKENEAKDGMDMAICIIDYEHNTLQFSGANSPLYLYRNNELQVIKGDRKSISLDRHADKPFVNHEIKIQDSDMIYLFTDGYKDQFSENEDIKFTTGSFKRLLESIANKNVTEQQLIIDKTINDWRGSKKQIDDILVMGIRLNPSRKVKKQENDWSDKVILIVEDTDVNYMLLIEALIKTNVNTIRAVTGIEAVQICQSRKDIDLVLMDINLPEMDGFEATKQIKKIRPELPVIAQTAQFIDDIIDKSKEAGCAGFFTKPIKLNEFIDNIKKYL